MKNPNSDQIFVVVSGGLHPQTSETFMPTEILDISTGNHQKRAICLGLIRFTYNTDTCKLWKIIDVTEHSIFPWLHSALVKLIK